MDWEEGRNPSPILKLNSPIVEIEESQLHKVIFHTKQFLDFALCQFLSKINLLRMLMYYHYPHIL